MIFVVVMKEITNNRLGMACCCNKTKKNGWYKLKFYFYFWGNLGLFVLSSVDFWSEWNVSVGLWDGIMKAKPVVVPFFIKFKW